MKIAVAVLLPLTMLLSGAFQGGKPQLIAQQTEQIRWMSWEEALQRNRAEKRKIFVDVYTHWCGWCKRLDNSTFKDPYIVSYINKYYYPVKFDAETKEDIVFNNKTYRFVNNGMRGYHELAAEITRGRLSYPTLVFIDENLEVIQAIPGYREPLELEMILTYFASDAHKRTPWEIFKHNYKRN